MAHASSSRAVAADHLLAADESDAAQYLKRPQAEYDPLSERREQFLLKERSYQQQYANVYFQRLNRLKAPAAAEAKRRWSKQHGIQNVLPRILDVQTGQLCCVVGTVYVDMKLKPNVLEDVAREHKVTAPPPREKYYADDDATLLEDESGRIVLSSDNIRAHHLVSGVVAAVLGRENSSGEFVVKDVCFPNLPPQPARPVSSGGRKYLALVSGVQIGAGHMDVLRTQLLAQYLRGELGSLLDQEEEADIVRVIFAGNTFSPLEVETDTRHSRRGGRNAPATASTEPTAAQHADAFLLDVCSSLDVDLMPGELDPATHALPQQPILPMLLPHSSQCSSLNTVTNPYWGNIAGNVVLGNSGQSLDDLIKYVDTEDRCYPFQDREPFIIDECPSIYFIGNQPRLETTLVQGPDGQQTRMILLPSFAQTGVLALVDLATLDCQSVTLDAAF
ncbi:DNA polymerase alpha/epsilon subunit B-domain-containing protein [Thamnocephalis sphaerospora]|uniref:DNA-directed DNA polymerase n=1 Tax=Thamnocephalis sphaerospora TaxID=78915 RepID=A0A4P9XXB5_9FUNG|nr:DNA polymerase alpha/epsilon subunit B-domain-containing protein [Thamnocephalis sphaerospora]|eukprot:RKP10662.1 DNA polymerase alpha/epsilon subunit B-domain-containing protein [Thamnocephalis sphaerospora]